VANHIPKPHRTLGPDLVDSGRRLFSAGGVRRIGALAGLSIRDALRSRVLLGMTLLTLVLAAGTLLWPADRDADRVVIVQRLCLGALMLFGLTAAAFLGGASLPKDVTTKRIYSIATKPVTRAEMLLGKIFGLLTVMLVFLILGGLITYGVTRIASARKSYAGGSYTLEVTSPSALLRTQSEGAQRTVDLKQGQLLEANAETENGYEVTVADREMGLTGFVRAEDVHLHERQLQVVSIATAATTTATARGRAEVALGELVLWCHTFAEGDTWSFDISDPLPDSGEVVNCRLRVYSLLHEPSRFGPPAQLPVVTLRITVPGGEDMEQQVRFTFVEQETRPVKTQGERLNLYEQVIALPRSAVANGKVQFDVLHIEPKYPVGGSVFFDRFRAPTWHLRGFRPSDLPEGRQTIQAEFLVINAEGLDLLDTAEVSVELRNPVTNEATEIQTTLRNRTPSNIHFDRRYIDERQGVLFTLKDMPKGRRLGYQARTAPVFLVLKSRSFAASMARSVMLIFLQLSVFTVLAVSASTFLSAPVAVLLTLFVALSGVARDFLVERMTLRGDPLTWPDSFASLAERVGVQGAAAEWFHSIFLKMLEFLAPSFTRFSSAEYITQGWVVPWAAVGSALAYVLPYTLLCLCIAYLLFRVREFE